MLYDYQHNIIFIKHNTTNININYVYIMYMDYSYIDFYLIIQILY